MKNQKRIISLVSLTWQRIAKKRLSFKCSLAYRSLEEQIDAHIWLGDDRSVFLKNKNNYFKLKQWILKQIRGLNNKFIAVIVKIN